MGSLIPDKYINNIFYLLSQSDHYINIWTDRPEETRLKFLDKIGGYSHLQRNKITNRLEFKQIFELENWCQINLSNYLTLIQMKTLLETFMFEYPNYSDRYNKYSLEVLYKLGNLATLSDILRLVILYKEGGIYIDCDNTFKGQHIKYNIKYSKNPNQYNICANCKFSLYSFHNIAGNSVLVANSGAQGCVEILKLSLDTIYKQQTGRELIDNIEKMKRILFTEKSYLKNVFDYFMSNSYIEKDKDLRRHGKDPNGYKLQILKDYGGVNQSMYHCGYPYAYLAMQIGPEVLKEFERNKAFSKRITEISIFHTITINSDQAWL
ncbi:hypothetical protein FTZ_1217 [Francisella tularensis subsp. tularensis MA00-2987]|nr:hypothetical protein NE061598_01965 [Francisella tularensis subsp. tularensis NE061598]AFB80858.1 hypothetical protein FTV_1208 [Francisella tularensis subsp. tularensis TI0902]AKE20281.1 tcdA/TcdB catalytic glycosyltransferase domain protein [Francisella tularensis subsp. tularensis str. SCHU S4 substr. NR-28534]AKZ20268.1 hypothetical protein FTZ_1217 [Francisella tularensis subsp. tularensis MA00-2987]ADA78071.1 hypothetical protein NE061598_02115 [Francisella tularensis subsp. tularensis